MMSVKKPTVVIVDDDIRVLRMIKRMLELENFEVVMASGGDPALRIFEKESPDLVLLDIMMPDLDGYTVCQRIREFSQVPIIMVTARDQDKDKVEGLDCGADDYVTKPFSASELAARIRAVMRRARSQNWPGKGKFWYKDMVVDFTAHRVMVKNRELKLTSTEYRLLSYLSLNAGRVLTPDQLLDEVWGEEYIGAPHLLQVNIARLRKKLGDSARNPEYIITRPGIGYIISKLDDDTTSRSRAS